MSTFRITVPARLGPRDVAELCRALELGARADARAWILAGAEPGTFCRGLDLSAVASSTDAEQAARGFSRALSLLAHASVPTIAVVAGDALGGGLGLAAACDLVLASPDARVGLPEALFGLVPAMVMPVLLTRTTAARARRLALSCATEPADQALSAGLFDRIVAADALEAASERAARDLARAARSAVPKLRELVHRAHGQPFDAALAEATELAVQFLGDQEVKRAVRRFLEDGEAPWGT